MRYRRRSFRRRGYTGRRRYGRGRIRSRFTRRRGRRAIRIGYRM